MERYKFFKTKVIILFGSRARGDYTDRSDYDILVVADDLPPDPREAYVKLVVPEHPEVHPVGMNTEVFVRKLAQGSTFLLEILDEGKILYADNAFLEDIRKICEKVRSRYVRRDKTWVRIS
ncbi:MAG: nucleotidyltransferase domain-containing protein [Infirmifilum sp.]